MNKSCGIAISANIANDIIVDIDDVICDTCTVLHQALTIETKQDKPIEEWTSFELSEVYDIPSGNVVNEIIVKYDIFSRVKPIVGVRESIEMLQSLGYKIHLCTARGAIDNHKFLTEDWLKTHNIPYDTLNFVPYGSKKSHVYRDISECFAYMFDDALSNIDDALDSGIVIKPILITRPWNAKHSRYLRATSLYNFCISNGWLS